MNADVAKAMSLRYVELGKETMHRLIIRLVNFNPLCGYTTRNISKENAVLTILRYEYGPARVKEWQDAQKQDT